MRRYTSPGLLALALAASACTPADAPNNNFDILAGVWDFTATRTIPASGTTCTESGTFVLVSPDALSLRGTVTWDGSCDDGISGPSPTSGQDSIRSATISPRVTFQRVAITGGAARCPDTVNVAPTLDALTGTSVCAGHTISWTANLVGSGP